MSWQTKWILRGIVGLLGVILLILLVTGTVPLDSPWCLIPLVMLNAAWVPLRRRPFAWKVSRRPIKTGDKILLITAIAAWMITITVCILCM